MKISELKVQMDARFAEVDARFAALETRFDAFEARFDAFEARIEDRFAEQRVWTDARIAAEGDRTRRHFDVVAESLRGDSAVVAQGVAALGKRASAIESERIPLVSTLSDHELRLRVLEQHRG